MVVDGGEVLLGFLGGGGTQPFVVLDFPAFEVLAFSPLEVLRDSEEAEDLTVLGGFDDGSDELLQEAVVLDERGPEVVEEVDQQTLDVGAVMVLISHDHDGAVA